MNIALLIGCSILVLAWIPILVKFFRNWRARANPISLAICFAVAYAIYICMVPFFGEGQDPFVVDSVVVGVNAVTCLFFHASFGWAKKRWAPGENSYERRGRSTDYPSNIEKPQ